MGCGLTSALIFELDFRALAKFMIRGAGGVLEVGASFSYVFLALATAICDHCEADRVAVSWAHEQRLRPVGLYAIALLV